jgi:hypothetical protein
MEIVQGLNQADAETTHGKYLHSPAKVDAVHCYVAGDEFVVVRASQIVRDSGYVGLARRASGYLYRHAIRRFLPTIESVRYAGVPISRDRKLGDLSVPGFLRPHNVQDLPDYEAMLIEGVRTHVRKGDKVVIVGGGEGVTVAIAAQAVGDTGSVICFEGGRSYVENVLGTARRNRLSGRITVRHEIVGKSISVHGDERLKSSNILPTEKLPECDVLELDCEGAEALILEEMRLRPRAIIVETHGLFGAPTVLIRSILERKGYDVSDLGWAEPGRIDECKQHDVRILTAILSRSL